MKQLFGLFVVLAGLFSSCATSGNITWTPKGGETATLKLIAEDDAKFLAIRSIDGQHQANPWTFYVPSAQFGSAPKILGSGKTVNAVTIDASTDYELTLGFYQPRGLLEKDKPEWHKSMPVITLKALEPKATYSMVLSGPVFSLGSGKQTFGILTVRKGLLESVQAWEFQVDGDDVTAVEVAPSIF